MTGQVVEFSVALNQRVRHRPTGSVGRVVGLLAGLEGRLLANIQYTTADGCIQGHWSLLSEIEPVAAPPPPAKRVWPVPEAVPNGITHVRGHWRLVEVLFNLPRPVPVAVVFVSDDEEVHSQVATGWQLLPALGHELETAHWVSDRARTFIETGCHSPRFRVSPSQLPVAGPSARELVQALFEEHVAGVLRRTIQ